MNADLQAMPKGASASAKWSILPIEVRAASRFAFASTMIDGRNAWTLDEIKLSQIANGSWILFAQISMSVGIFAFAFSSLKKDVVLVDFHLSALESLVKDEDGLVQ